MRDILLIDNGSKQAEATISLRRIALALGDRLGEAVHPVSLLHADTVPADALEGRPAETFEPLLRRRLAQGVRDFLLVPLFFGPTRAIKVFVPERIAALQAGYGPFAVRLARELCPLPEGEPGLVEILLDHIGQVATAQGIEPRRVLLVDHGSPAPAVTAVRRWLGERLAWRLGPGTQLEEAAMERRGGTEYDFNGDLLEDRLDALASLDPSTPVILSMLFLSPGRHAGPGGDIAEICGRIERLHPSFRIYPSPLVGGHPRLVHILADRVAEMENARPAPLA
ncbi:MAG: cobalamin biosynthesis protein CbiX [Thiocapsa sp.]|nr:cobalamin biosynthesis protein CbiX [Thiocapsa sp.]MCG6986063.1 cobalamin biosynthesis protein CbiX [Thiocapsa sp.]